MAIEVTQLDAQTRRALALAIAKWRGEDFREAGMDLARLVNRAQPDIREAMSAQVQAALGMTLAELAVDVHWRAALAARRGPAIRLEYVTEYEKPALMVRMTEAFDAALRSREQIGSPGRRSSRSGSASESKPSAAPVTGPVAVDDRADTVKPLDGRPVSATRPWYESVSPTSGPASIDPQASSTEFAVIDWLHRPEEFTGTTAQAKMLAARTAYATSILNEWLRLDVDVSRNRELKREILLQRKRLAALSKVLSSRIAHPSRYEPDPKSAEVERVRREEYGKQQADQQKAYEEEVRKAREEARKWQAEQDRQADRKPGWFDWFKPKAEEENK